MDHGVHARTTPGLSANAYRTMVASAPDMCVTLQPGSGTILECNEAVRTTLGYAPGEIVGRSVLSLADPDDTDSARRSWQTLVEAADLPASHVRARRKDGGRLDVCVTARTVHDDTGRVAFGLAVLRATPSATAHDGREPKRLRALLYALSVAEERERRRIAAGLHDELGQLLAIAKLKLGRLGATDTADARGVLTAELGSLIDQASRTARSATFELSSPVLEQFGLDAAIQSLGERMERVCGIAFRFDSDGRPCHLPDDTSVVLLRVVRELLFNVHKHARAREARVTVRRADAACTIVVEDDGDGFDGPFVADFTPAGGFGLFSAQAQIESIGGRFSLESRVRHGTRATLRIPMPSEPEPR